MADDGRDAPPRSSAPATSATDSLIFNFVVDSLRAAEPTLVSVSSSSLGLQQKCGGNPELIRSCLQAAATYLKAVDWSSRLTAFYVINDLLQRDVRFRLPALTLFIPAVGSCISEVNNRDPYLKTVDVWGERKVYPTETCLVIKELFESAAVKERNAKEFETRLEQLSDICQIRSAVDEKLEGLLGDGDAVGGLRLAGETMDTDTASAIMTADDKKLKDFGAQAQSALSATSETLGYICRLMLDFEERYSRPGNIEETKELLSILESASLGTAKPSEPIVL